MLTIPRGIRPYLYGAAAALLIGLLIYAYTAGRQHQAAVDAPKIRAAQLETENALARADSTYYALIDSVAVAYRRAQQLELAALQLTDSLKVQRVMSARLTIAVDTLRARVAAAVTVDSAGTRYASFHEQQGPITVDVDVEMPVADSARASIVASVTPPVLDIDAGCRDAPAGGIRSAYLAASAAGWGRVGIGSAVFTPDVCNAIPVIIKPDFGQRLKIAVPWMVLAAAGGFYLGSR